MTAMTAGGMGRTGRTPWHLWAVGGVGLLWNGFGLTDCVMSLTRGEAWLRSFGMTEPQIAYFHAMPAWAYAVWALGVGAAFAGSVLLVLRSRWALHAFSLSMVGLVGSAVYTYGLSNGAEVMGDTLPMQAVVWVGALFQLWYAWTMSKRGVLR